MKASDLDRQITIQRKSVTHDATYGTEVVEWVPLVALPGSPVVGERFWAQVQDVMPSRSEQVKNGLAMSNNQARIRFRYRDDIDSTMRVIVHGDVDITYQIIGGPAAIQGRKTMTEIMCEKYSTVGGQL